MGVTYHRHSARVINSKRWPALRLAAKRRDGFKCVQCGAVGKIEIDHIMPVRDRPELAFELTNLQSLCPRCHTRKTRLECGHDPLNPARQAWRDLVRSTSRKETCNA